MSDEADLAAEIEAELIARGLARVDRAIPAGVPGECDDCGEAMPRLVDVRCGFCRDGRRPPLGRFDDADAPPSPRNPTEEPAAMPNAKPSDDFQVISIRERGETLRAIRELADAGGVTLPTAALELIDRAFDDAAPEPVPIPEAVVLLANLPDVDLIAELGRRLASGVGSDDYDAATERAEAAEAKLAQMRALLSAQG